MKTKRLNLSEAYDLYVLIKPVFPDEDKTDGDVFEFVNILIENIIEYDPKLVSDILGLLSGAERDKILSMGTVEALEVLLEGLVENKIVSLMDFFDGIING